LALILSTHFPGVDWFDPDTPDALVATALSIIEKDDDDG
jgi:hypothetical protein